MALMAAVSVGGARMRGVTLVPSETIVTWTEGDEFSHLGTSSHSSDFDWTSTSKLLTGRCNSPVVLKRPWLKRLRKSKLVSLVASDVV